MKNSYLVILFAFLALSFNGQTQQIDLQYNFSKPSIIVNADGYAEIYMDQCLNYGEEGYPLLPKYGIDLLLPQGKAIEKVEVTQVNFSKMISNTLVVPASRLFPISQGIPANYKVTPNPAVYENSDPYPASIINGSNTGWLAGHGIGSFSIDPVKFYPETKSIQYITHIEITVFLKDAESGSKRLKNAPLIQQRIRKIVDNQGILPEYSYPEQKNSETDLLLITNELLEPHFEEYLNYKRSLGFVCELMTTENIYSQYSGDDEQEKIRNCIIDIYEGSNLQYVILGGDSDPNNSSQDVIPHRGFFAVDDNDIPADMYYCCLDGTWNDDGDNRWGESGEYDLYAEVAIGRICVDNSAEIENFTHKLYMYQNEPVLEDIEKCLMIGEELNDNPWTFGGDYKDEIANGGNYNGFYTEGVSDNFDISRLYDRDMSWNKNHVFNIFNNVGSNLLNHLGHSSPTYNMKMNNSDITTGNFTNDGINRGYPIGYSQGCYNGSFDNRDWNNSYGQDCFAEKITTLATAEVASVANSRYGWYSPGATNSTSQYVDRQFYDAIFGEEITEIGFTNGDSKEDVASYFTNSDYMRWTVYELNLFGDPSMDIWTEYPGEITPNYSASIPIGVSSFEISTNVNNARVGLMQNNVLIGRGLTDSNGNAIIDFFEPLSETETISLSVIAHNKFRYIGEIVVVSDQPYVIFDNYEINDLSGNGNQLPDYGEEISLGLSVKNVGNQPATNVEVSLSCSDYVTFTDLTENYGDFAAGEVKYIEDAFTFSIADNIPDGYQLNFCVTAAGEDNWESNFYMTVLAPQLHVNTFIINDENGNNNGRLDPGEMVEITYLIRNNGSSAGPEISAMLEVSNSFIQVITESVEIDILEPEEMAELSFMIAVNPSTPVGSMTIFNLQVDAMAYSINHEANLKIGMFVEDWETGTFEQYEWSTSGHEEWFITENYIFEGQYSTQSGNIGDNEFSQLSLFYHCMYDDTISFYVKVSTEESYDYLKFYIDGELIDQWAGEQDWQKVSYAVDDGNHLFRWKYEKDTYVSSGYDCVWLDFIELPTPFMTTAFAGPDGQICAGEEFYCTGEAQNYNEVEWTSSGNGEFDDPTILNPVYTPDENDINNGDVTLTFSATGNTGSMTDDLLLTIHQLPLVELGPDTSMCISETMILDAGNPGSTYLWSTGETTQTIEASSGGNAGTIAFTVEVTNEQGCISEDEIIIEFTECTGIAENDLEDMIIIRPNPGNGIFHITLPAIQCNTGSIEIYNSTKQVVFSSEGEFLSTSSRPIDISNCKPGLYIVKITFDDIIINKKLIISE